jgi:hypothetical protein
LDYHSVIKVKSIDPHTRMNLKPIILHERSQCQNAIHCIIQFIRHSGKVKPIGRNK